MKHKNVIQIETPRNELLGYVFWGIKSLFYSLKLDPDIVHCHGLEGAILCNVLFLFKKKRIFHLHNSITREATYYGSLSHLIGLLILKSACRSATIIVAPSKASKDDLVSSLGQSISGRVIVVPNFAGIPSPVSEEQVQELRRKLAIGTRKVILYFGKIKPSKGLEYICRAYNLLKEEKEVSLVLAGLPIATNRFVEKLKLKYPDVIFAGYVENPSLYYKMADVFCIYTDGFAGGETFAVSLAEAMRHGLPVVTSENRVYKEVTHGFGLYAKPNDEKSLARMLKLALSDRELAKRNAAEGKKVADALYETGVFIQKMGKIYRSLIQDNRTIKE